MSDIIFLTPTFNHTVWGGDTLRTEFGYDEPGDDIGECWGISAHPHGDTVVSTGEHAGMHLSELWKRHRELFGDVQGESFPLLAKIISARDDLSIQVHPDDEYARIHEDGALGKTECWYVLSADPGSQLVVGHNARSREELCAMIDEGRWDELIRRVDVVPGDFLQIEPGTVHAICGGVTLLETQENSDITYRLYDYGRMSGGRLRTLHPDQSKAVITVPSPETSDMIVHDDSESDVVRLVSCPSYEVYRIRCHDELTFDPDRPFLLMSVVDGEGRVGDQKIRKGSHFIVPSGYGPIRMSGDFKIIASCLPVRS